MMYKWSYKVKKGDDNYDLRTDTVNDYFDFESYQNFQIELHYQECCSGRKKFGDKYIIVGDMFGVQKIGKNGKKYKYHVWGTSKDSATWFEQNCTIKGAPVRQLWREMIIILKNEDDQANSSGKSSNKNDHDDKDSSEANL